VHTCAQFSAVGMARAQGSAADGRSAFDVDLYKMNKIRSVRAGTLNSDASE